MCGLSNLQSISRPGDMIILTRPSNSSIITKTYEQSGCFQNRLYSELHDMLENDNRLLSLLNGHFSSLLQLSNFSLKTNTEIRNRLKDRVRYLDTFVSTEMVNVLDAPPERTFLLCIDTDARNSIIACSERGRIIYSSKLSYSLAWFSIVQDFI